MNKYDKLVNSPYELMNLNLQKEFGLNKENIDKEIKNKQDEWKKH